jgi:hypothetical protein
VTSGACLLRIEQRVESKVRAREEIGGGFVHKIDEAMSDLKCSILIELMRRRVKKWWRAR